MATIEINHGKRHEIIDEVKKLTETIRQSRRKQQLLEEGITELKKARMRKMANLFGHQFHRKSFADMQTLTTSIQAKLPREIRDMIYKHICVLPKPIQFSTLFTSPSEPVVPLYTGLQILFSAPYLALATFREMWEVYWSLNTFEVKLGPGKDYDDEALVRLFQHSPLTAVSGVQVEEPYQIIRHLRIRIPVTMGFNCIMTRSDRKEDLSTGQLAMIKLANQLVPVMLLRDRKNLHIEFLIDAEFRRTTGTNHSDRTDQHERRFANILEALRRCYFTLKHSGVKVSLEVKNTEHFGRIRSTTSRWDCTSRLVLNEEIWRKDMEEYSSWNSDIGVWDHYIPHSMLRNDRDAFRGLLWQRWRLRHALPWLDPTSEDEV